MKPDSPQSTFRRTALDRPAANLLQRLAVLCLVLGGVAACGSDGAQSDQSDPGDMTDVTHELQPTEQMRQAAEQQCIDNPDQEIGYVKAVAPETGKTLAEIELDCSEVRPGG